MFKRILSSFSMAIDNIRMNIFHTFLSVLGIIIGVAALVGILSLIDGMEKYARDQITQTTSLRNLTVQTETIKSINGLRIKKDSFAVLSLSQFTALLASLPNGTKGALNHQTAHEIAIEGLISSIPVLLNGVTLPFSKDTSLLSGRIITTEDLDRRHPVCIINFTLAKQIDSLMKPENILGKHLEFQDKKLSIVGVIQETRQNPSPKVYFPITLLNTKEWIESPPSAFFEASVVEEVPLIKLKIEDWLKKNFAEKASDFQIITNEFRVEQAAQGFLLFRIVMGLIVGISVLVGGIGIMNVLLISVNDRTMEIGLRKAMGATKKDIMRQFLSESVTISVFGSLAGLILGILTTMLFVPVVKSLTEIPFQAAYTLNTLVIIAVVAVVVGILFGTYPAIKAARLDPVEAIRRE